MPRRTISLYHRIERALETIAAGSTPLQTIQQTADFLATSFSDDLGLIGGRIYRLDDESYELVATFGGAGAAILGQRVDPNYAPIRRLFDTGTLVMHRDDPELDPSLESLLGTREVFATAIVDGGNFILSFDVDAHEENREDLVSTLNIVRLAINQQLREERMAAVMEEARQIQTSILPRHMEAPGQFVVAARSLPAEVVGGDFYDLIPMDETAFSVVVADATGHGLPAALQVRDVFTGLRMGLSREYKLGRTLERLNGIIHGSRMATKFVSLFLAEIDLDGTMIHCSAGHPPALLVRASGEIERLAIGGLPLGPFPNARYTAGLTQFHKDDTLVMYSDGITEAHGVGEIEFGMDRLETMVVASRHLDPEALVENIFEEVSNFSGGKPAHDDQTVLVVQWRRSSEAISR
ncbi:MAG: PP2C family protein-serine/threonine phosphatase [Acidobacteria bacterium]|nr:PP2C family protein-serine/threonine phosphatase [Acidobacteriota bacterium]